MNKTFIFVGIVISLLIVLFSALFLRNKPEKDLIEVIKGPLAVDPRDKNLEKTPSTAVYSFASAPNLDATLPAFTFKKASREQAVKLAYDMADLLNMTATPTSLLKGDVFTTTWNQFPDLFLQISVSSDNSTISFEKPKTPSVKSVGQSVSIESLLSPITSAVDVQIDLENGAETEFDGLLVLDRPLPLPFTQKLVRYVKNNVIIATGDMNISAGSFVKDARGEIRSATISLPLFITGIGGNVKTLSQDQILDSLTEGRGRIISQGKISGKTIGQRAPFTQFIIRDVKPFYAPDNRLLLPAVVLSGDAVVNGKTESTKVFLWNYASSR